MAQAKVYLLYLLYASLVVGFAMILWQYFKRGQWKLPLLCIAFLPLCGGGFLVALIIGWQEAGNWKFKNLMRIYSVLFVLSAFFFVRNSLDEFLHPPVEVQVKKKGANR